MHGKKRRKTYCSSRDSRGCELQEKIIKKPVLLKHSLDIKGEILLVTKTKLVF